MLNEKTKWDQPKSEKKTVTDVTYKKEKTTIEMDWSYFEIQ